MRDAADVQLRECRPGDEDAVRRVEARAFGRVDEARIVDALRSAGAITLELVAERGGEVVGHLLFSPVVLDGPRGPGAAIGLAPLAVDPEHQRQGIGDQLVRHGLDRLRAAGHGAVFVLGSPDYYGRFGFAPADRLGLRWEHPCPPQAFMALRLRPDGLAPGEGVVRYHPAFG